MRTHLKIVRYLNKTFTQLPTATVKWVGSISSLVIHTLLFALNFSLYFFGVAFDTVLLILTTVVSIEAIYLAIFMQISINQQSTLLSEDIELHEEVKK